MEYQKILMGLLSKAYKLDDGTIGEILNAENADEKKRYFKNFRVRHAKG